MTAVSFDYPWLLALGLVLPGLAIWFVRSASRRRQIRLRRLGSLDVVRRLMPSVSLARPGWRMARLAGAGALLGVAAAGPRWGEERNVIRSSGIDMVLALDASLSMLATDEHPNRLERMKEEVRRLLAMSPNDRVGLLAFAGRSYVLSPVTVDQGALDLFLDNLDPSTVGQAGSSVARTIHQGVDLLSLSKSGADKALVVMSDWEAFEPLDDIVAEAKRAGDAGIALVTVGFGTTTGSTIPIKNPDGSSTLKRDENGNIVVTQYHPEVLKATADAARGTAIEAGVTDKAARVKSALALLRGKARAATTAENKTPRFQWFVLPALVLLLIDTLMVERQSSRGAPKRGAAAQRTAAAGVLLTMMLGGCARVSRLQQGAADYHRGQYTAAASLYRDAIAAGDKSAHTLYNYGTALVAGDSLAAAKEPLGRVTTDQDPEVRYRGLFNLGLAHLKEGLGAPTGQGADALDSALSVYKTAILMHPEDVDAKWNYELALRQKQSGGGGGGGGGGGQSNANTPSPQSQAPQPVGGLGAQQADQILGSAAREERDVQAKQQKQNRVQPPPGGKDW